MPTIDVGDPLPNLSVRTFDANKQPANAGSIALTITLPDLTTTSPAVTNPSTGVYEATYLTVQAGRHAVRWLATGVNASAYPTAYLVRPADPGMAFDLATAKEHLNEQGSLQDEEIGAYLEVATAIVEGIIAGPVATRTYTERVRNGTWLLKLLHSPVVSVTSITSIKTPTTTWLTADLDVDAEYGIVYRADQQFFTNGPWTVVYKAGRVVPKPNQIHAVKAQLWSMWFDQRGATADQTSPDLLDVAEFESRVPFGLGFAIPYKVNQLLDSDLIPGIA